MSEIQNGEASKMQISRKLLPTAKLYKAIERPPKAMPSKINTRRQLLRENPLNLLLAIFLFSVLVASGIAIAVIFARNADEEKQQDALALAKETGLFFSQNLDDAILPLFSLAQFVNELDIFQNLTSRVGLKDEENSLPFLPPKVEGEAPTHRNIEGVCDDTDLVTRFEKIAGDIKKNSGMDGILVNLQLVPDAVVCLLHPVNNTEDFPPGVFMDNSGALGHDLLSDPERKFIAEATVPSDKVVIAGPLSLKQCQDCDPTVEKAFIARLPIPSETNTIIVNGVPHKKWGFAVALINWNELIRRSGVFDVFEGQEFEFQLTRTDQKYNPDFGNYTEKVVVLAESANFRSRHDQQVKTILPTTNNDWEITVIYCTSGCNHWLPWAITGIIFFSLCIACLVFIIFTQKQLHSDMLAQKQAEMVENSRKAVQSERELNDFIAHEVRNPLSAALSATSFVSATVHEVHPLVDQNSRDSVREDVRVIESSLQFINDLLRSMLDLHRARSNQLVLEKVPTDVRKDILDPVASMLYHRDSMFSVQVQCPDNLIVSVDRLRLKQIVLNLARNSTKFVEKGFVRLRAESTNEGIIIFVEDSGPGIPLEKRIKIFSRFQDSLDELSQGTGIGLSLCKKLVDLMGGTIKHDDCYHSGIAKRPGTKFDIHINCDVINIENNEADTEDESNCSPDVVNDVEGNCSPDVVNDVESGLPNMDDDITSLPEELRILFVDDDVVLRKLFSRSLKRVRPQWTIHEAASGESALLLVESEIYDVIFMDQYMTSVDKQLLGTETTRKLRSLGVRSLICGLSANDMEKSFKSAGADTFMIKPFPCKPEPMTQELLRILNKKDFVF